MGRPLRSFARAADAPRLHECRLDLRVLAFTAAFSIGDGAPLRTPSGLGVLSAESGGDAQGNRPVGSPGRRQRRIFGTLVTAQFALAVVLLVAGGLLVRSFTRLMAVDPGFRAEQVLTLATACPPRLIRRARRSFVLPAAARGNQQLPGVTAAARFDRFTAIGPRATRVYHRGRAATPATCRTPSPRTGCRAVFRGAGDPAETGAVPVQQDQAGSEPVVVINETMARRSGTDRNPSASARVGRTRNHGPWMRIVGVVADVKQGPLSTETMPQTYPPWVQVGDGMLAENIVGALRGA